MICRPAVKPVFVGLGTAAILAAGGASAIAAETPSPSPSGSGTTSPAPGKLDVTVEPAATAVDPGESVRITTTIKVVEGDVPTADVTNITASLKGATIGGDCGEPFDAEECTAEDLTPKNPGTVHSTVEIPKAAAEETTAFTVTVTVEAENVEPASGTTIIRYVVPSPTSPPPKSPDDPPSSSKPPSKPSPTDSGGGSGGSGDGGDSGSGSDGDSDDGSSGGSGSSGGGSGGDSSSISDGGYTPPEPNSSFDPRDPEVALPPIQAPNPSVAPSPNPAGTPQSRLQGNEAPVAQDLTFERMASTQIAWLAALLVAFSLLLTQLRLGRRRLPAGATKRVKGMHRRPRKGLFGK